METLWYVVVQENVHRQVTNVKGHPQPPTNYQQVHVYQGSNVRGHQQQFINYQKGGYCRGFNLKGHSEEQQGSTDVFSSISENRTAQALRPCIFCKGEHYNDEIESPQHQNVRKNEVNNAGVSFV